MNISNILFYKKTICKRKYLFKKCFHIREINENIILFFDKSLEELENYLICKECLYRNI